jgi:hypothetical protein
MTEITMNWFEPPDGVTQRVIARCGVVHPHADLDPKRTALIVVDLQNAFMDDAVGHAVCPMAREIVPNVNRLASVVRGAGGGVFWIKNTFDERSAYEWSNAQAMLTPTSRERRIAAMSENTKGRRCGRNSMCVRRTRSSANAVQRIHAGDVRPAVSAARARVRYRADHRDSDQCLLRVIGARCDDDQLRRSW